MFTVRYELNLEIKQITFCLLGITYCHVLISGNCYLTIRPVANTDVRVD